MTKQEFWQTHHGKALSNTYITAKAEFEAALNGDAPALVSVYRNAFRAVCMDISDAICLIDVRMSEYYRKLAESYA